MNPVISCNSNRNLSQYTGGPAGERGRSKEVTTVSTKQNKIRINRNIRTERRRKEEVGQFRFWL
jgi:hypothetical protein